MKKLILTTAAFAFIATSHAWAEGPENNPCMPPMPHKEMANKSEEERKAFRSERKEEWQGMSDAEKVQIIEQKRAERMQKMDTHWATLSDAQKVKCAEIQMKKRMEKRKDK